MDNRLKWGEVLWVELFTLWFQALRVGGLRLLRAVEKRRTPSFREPVKCGRFFAIGYVSPPSALHGELAWLREMGVRRVVLTLEQAAPGMHLEKALGAIRNLHTEECRVSAVLRQKAGAEADVEAWHAFCSEMMAQIGWQLERAQWGEGFGLQAIQKGDDAGFSRLFACLPGFRRDYPGVAFLSPCIERFTSVLGVRSLLHLLPDGYAWDCLAVRAPAWRALESVGQDGLFLRKLARAGAISSMFGVEQGRIQVEFPPAPSGCDAAASERIAGSIVRRTILVLASGLVERVVAGVDPAVPVDQRSIFTTAMGRLMRQLEGARFLRRVWVGHPDRDYLLEFDRIDGSPLLVAWTEGPPHLVTVPFRVLTAGDFLGRNVPLLPCPRLRLTRNLAYYCG